MKSNRGPKTFSLLYPLAQKPLLEQALGAIDEKVFASYKNKPKFGLMDSIYNDGDENDKAEVLITTICPLAVDEKSVGHWHADAIDLTAEFINGYIAEMTGVESEELALVEYT